VFIGELPNGGYPIVGNFWIVFTETLLSNGHILFYKVEAKILLQVSRGMCQAWISGEARTASMTAGIKS
jgi:hypothetical protein